jgi:beta-galactosidase
MRRRDFIKTTGTVLAGTALSTSETFAETPEPVGRIVLPINRGWRYHPAKVEGAYAPDFDDSAFERVVVPHTNVQLPWHDFDDRDYEFISTYRRRFRLPTAAAGKRVFVDFEGVMTASTVWLNGVQLGEYKGGFTPFSFELTNFLRRGAENVLVVQVDSTERTEIPPFGNEIDYMTFGGIYREVALRIVPQMYIDNIFARPKNVLSNPALEVDCFVVGKLDAFRAAQMEVELRDGERVVAKKALTLKSPARHATASITKPAVVAPVHLSSGTRSDPARKTVTLDALQGIELWSLEKPTLYTVVVRLLHDGQVIDQDTRRIGFREATFTDQGFSLNGKIVKLRGLDRHQTFPFVGQAMPGRVQRQDAKILRNKLHCNIVRTSHYPQSRHFLDCCDEIGLLVLEEIPGWQHIGGEEWQQISVDNVDRMIRRDWNHPSIILWGVRINESRDNHDFYVKTNALAHALDSTRQTGGIRYFQESEFLEDVFTMNDFGFPLKKPNHPKYLNTEFVGHTFPTKTTDDNERQREHTLRHVRVHNQLASDPQYSGGIAWCAFDYNTHDNFGAGDRICYHGVADMFRELKFAGGFYQSQCEPEEQIVLEPAFHWAKGDESVGFTKALVSSNCDHLKFYMQLKDGSGLSWKLLTEIEPDRAQYGHLKYPPFLFDLDKLPDGWGDLRIDGYINGKQVISKTLSGHGTTKKFSITADDLSLVADGADTTRIVLRATDEYGALSPYANDSIALTLEGPGQLIGDNPFALVGGSGAVWVRTSETPGTLKLTAKHPRLGAQTVTLQVAETEAEKA